LKISTLFTAASFAALIPAAYAAGLDTTLSTADSVAYRHSLDEAWKHMSEAQQKAYNWAVGDASLGTLASKYPELTPRKVIERETEDYIARKTASIADMQAELAADADKLAREEKIVLAALAELAKVTISETGFQKIPDASGREELRFNFTVNNASQSSLASAKWDARLFLNDKEQTGRYCQITTNYSQTGGLASGNSNAGFVTITPAKGSGATTQCPQWNTPEVQQAASPIVKITLDPGSALDLGNTPILPHFSPVRADYERNIASEQEDLKTAQKMRAALNG